MRIATTLTGTVLAAACLFGLTGLSSVANAAEPTTGNVATSSAVGADTNIQASRHFTVTNNSSDTLVVNKVFFVTGGCTSASLPEDSYPANGTRAEARPEPPVRGAGLVRPRRQRHPDRRLGAHGRRLPVRLRRHAVPAPRQNIPGTGAAFQLTPQPSIGLLTIGDPHELSARPAQRRPTHRAAAARTTRPLTRTSIPSKERVTSSFGSNRRRARRARAPAGVGGRADGHIHRR